MAAGRRSLAANPERLGQMVIDLSACLRESQVLETLVRLLKDEPGVTEVALFSSDPDRPANHPLLQLAPDPSERRVRGATAGISKLLSDGQAVTLGRDGCRRAGLQLSDESATATILPATGPRSTMGLAVFWNARAPRPAPDTLDRLGILATTASLAISQIDARRRELRSRADAENRIRNTVAIIRSVSTRSADRAASFEDFILHFEGRLDALARAQVALARTSGNRFSFEPLLLEELLAQGIQDGPDVDINGMPVALDRKTLEMLCLAIHELAVNAVKYGVFSEKAGKLSIRWWLESRESGLTLRFDWHEESARETDPAPRHYGFGRNLIERALPFELDADTRIEFQPRGLICSIAIPVRGVGVREGRS